MLISSDVKRRIIGVMTLIVIFIILGALFLREQPMSPELRDYNIQAQKIFENAKIQFENMRNVILPSNIKLFVYTKQQAVDRWGKAFSSLGTDSVEHQENIYKSLFLMAEEESLSSAVSEWVSSWTAVTVGNEIYVIYENFWPWDILNAEATLIHELTHVWQSGLSSPDNYDMNLAYNALIEGDASYMADYYITRHNTVHLDSKHINDDTFPLLPSFLWSSSIYPNVPNTFTELNRFPYVYGKIFVSTLFDNGNWDRVNRCYTQKTAPSTTTQILHPDKYFTGEIAKNTFAPTPICGNWTLINSKYGSSDTYGEYFIYVMLNNWLSNVSAQNASSGWSGDSFVYYENNQDFLLVWDINWSSLQDASEFNQAFKNMLNLTSAKIQNDNNNVWFTNGRYLTVTCDPTTTTTLILCSTIQTAVDPIFFI
ncbi:MAG: hypothetical protein LBE76_09490 [Nitrososphaerota archaeon]|jgi:hypothetical protein|nr:hypothetical protein [Nitrososphaerota archaeon]